MTKFVTDFGERFVFKEVSAKAQNQFGGAWAQGPQVAPPKLVFGFWLDMPGRQDGALGHHAGVLHDSPGNHAGAA